jgi:prolyl-tRNA synthetase
VRYSQLLIPTVKEVPAEAEIPSHQLMIRAGFIRKLASGTYTYLPLGYKSILKIIAIVRAEMNSAGAQEILMPILQPAELWRQTGRDEVFKDIICHFKDRHGRENILAPTAEEVVTALVAAEVSSYRQLPINLYQIHDKFRDEFRPQYGVIRSREFIMKDAYSFDADTAGLDKSYDKMFKAYQRIFSRCGLAYRIVEADSGGMGGTDTQEFMVPSTVGDVLVSAEDNSYAANIEKADVDPIQPAADLAASRAAVPAMAEVHTPNVGTIEAVCNFLATAPADMIKTIIFSAPQDKQAAPLVVVALVRGDHEINESKLKAAAGGLELALADEATIKSLTGAAIGFAGPQGLAGRVCKLVVDHAVAAMAFGATGANKTDYHVKNVVPGRDFPLAGENVVVADIRNAVATDTYKGKKLSFSNGIEVGHVFKLGTKYSLKLGATYLDEKGQASPCVMGCYGIGVNRILACAIEMAGGHDDNGCILPISIAPFEVEVVPLSVDAGAVMDAAQNIYAQLQAGGVDVLIDDRDARPGVKFKDADLLGIPLRITVGQKGLAEGKVELNRRTDAKPTLVPIGEVVAEALKIVSEMKQALG